MTQTVDDIAVYADKNGYVADKEIVDTSFRYFEISRLKKIQNTIFKKGGMEGGSDISLLFADLENVTFDNFKCGRIHIYASHSKLNNVTFKGSKMRSLYVRPHPNLANDPMGDNGDLWMDNISMDISKFTREVDIVGINPDKIKINPSRHLLIDSRPLKNMPKRFLSQNFTSLIRHTADGPSSSKASFGVYDIRKRDLEDETYVEELKKISDLGILMNNIDDLI